MGNSHAGPGPKSHTGRNHPGGIPLLKASTATTYTTATGRHAELKNPRPSASVGLGGAKHNNSLEAAAAKMKPPPPRPDSHIPKSRTMNVFSNLTNSLSRASLGSFTRENPRDASASSSGTAAGGPGPGKAGPAANASAVPLPVEQPANTRQVTTAQPPSYWAGRFVALQDRFQNEILLPANLATLVSAHAGRSMVAASQAALLADEENRTRRIFLHLEALCKTSEARRSLRAWQVAYARREGKVNLVPQGESMDDNSKGWMGRVFTGGRKRNSIAEL